MNLLVRVISKTLKWFKSGVYPLHMPMYTRRFRRGRTAFSGRPHLSRRATNTVVHEKYGVDVTPKLITFYVTPSMGVGVDNLCHMNFPA